MNRRFQRMTAYHHRAEFARRLVNLVRRSPCLHAAQFARLRQLLLAESGTVITSELVVISTLTVVGLVVGLTSLRDSIVAEISDWAGAIQDVDQSLNYNGVAHHGNKVSGSDFRDSTDFCDDPEDAAGRADNCVVFDIAPSDESLPQIRTPSLTGIRSGGTLDGSSHTFTWSANGTTGITYWWLFAGSTQGGRQYASRFQGNNLSGTLTGLPTDGSPVWVRLWYRLNGRWEFEDTLLNAAGP